MNPASRDPLVQAAARVRETEGLATKVCEACFSAGRELRPPEAYVARALDGVDAGKCWLVYSCPVCGNGSTIEIPDHFLLARELRQDPAAVERAAESTPSIYYEVDGVGRAIFYADPADGGDPVLIAEGDVSGTNVRRARAVFDFLAGGSARRRIGR